ncbi:MAG: iron ABC transporter permease [Chloroflexi bacterium]|nr:iron ABC transporter permease [Chloroflexota bacterium]
MMRAFRPTGLGLLTVGAVAALTYLVLVPLAVQIVASFRGPYLPVGVPTAQWGIANYPALYAAAGDFAVTVQMTAVFVGGSMVISLVLAGVCAWLVARTDLPGARLVYTAVLLPLIIPPIVRAQAFTLMLAPKAGLVNLLLRLLPPFAGASGPIDPFTMPALVAVQGLSGMTFPFVLLVPIFEHMNGTFEEAARTHGASAWQTLTRVTLPLLRPGVLSVFVLGLILTLGSFEIPLLLGAQAGNHIFALRLWTLVNSVDGELPRYGVAAAYGVNFMVLTFGLFYLYSRATQRAERYATVSGKTFRAARHHLGRWTAPAMTLAGLTVMATGALLLVALLWSALTPYPMPMNLANLRQFASARAFGLVFVSGRFWTDLGRSILVAAASATIAVGIGAILGRQVARGGERRMRWLDLLASSSLAIPSTIAGFSALLFYLVLNRSIPLIGTLWVLILAYSYRVAVAYRLSLSGVVQINRELEEAAAMSGATGLTAFRRVILPLLKSTLAGVWVQLFILGAQELTIAVFLTTPKNETLPILIFNSISTGAAQNYVPDQGAAMALLYTALVFGLAYVLRVLTSPRRPATRRPKVERRPAFSGRLLTAAARSPVAR